MTTNNQDERTVFLEGVLYGLRYARLILRSSMAPLDADIDNTRRALHDPGRESAYELWRDIESKVTRQ